MNFRSPGADAEVIDPGAPAPVVFGPTLDSAAAPSEVYAPNSSTQFDAAGAWSTQPKSTVVPISAETAEQTSYREELFDGFGTRATPVVAAPRAAEPAAAEIRSEVFTGTTRD